MKDKKNVPNKIDLKDPYGKKFNIPVEGSLGLLALGAIGLIAWREKKREVLQNK